MSISAITINNFLIVIINFHYYLLTVNSNCLFHFIILCKSDKKYIDFYHYLNQKDTWMWCILALTKLQACLTSSSAFFRCARCSGCCRSRTQATSILGLPGTVVYPDVSLCVPTLSVLEIPSTKPDCEAAIHNNSSYIKYIYVAVTTVEVTL